ncbi:c-type cytochrome [Compostibacter hankyongensis]
MTHRKKWLAGLAIVGIMSFASLSFRDAAPPKPHKPQNLKVLPKDIDHMALIKIMHDFCDALDFKCGDCHAKSTTKPGDLDFASDANPHKDVARNMMRMVKKINGKHFKVKGSFAENFVNNKYEVTCYSCHHGSEHPAKEAPAVKK